MNLTLKRILVRNFGQLYSEELGIDLASRREKEIFKWFIASVLFGARINETIAKRTFAALIRHGLDSPRKILKAGWSFLVRHVMGEGGYVRYDGITSEYLLGICKKLIEDYKGKITNLYKAAKSAQDLKARLLQFRGVGPITVNIFLREMRGIWPKAKPQLNKFTKAAMANLGLTGRPDKRTEVALLRLGKNFCRRKKCPVCPVRAFCKKV